MKNKDDLTASFFVSLCMQGCTEKDKLIDSQYAALSNLKNLSLCQDKYTQVRITASARTRKPR
jgi:hypothetical protein